MTAAQEASLKEKREKEQREEEARQRAYQEQEAHRARAASLGRKRFLEDTHRQDEKRKKKRRNQQREQMALLLQATVWPLHLVYVFHIANEWFFLTCQNEANLLRTDRAVLQEREIVRRERERDREIAHRNQISQLQQKIQKEKDKKFAAKQIAAFFPSTDESDYDAHDADSWVKNNFHKFKSA